MKFFSSAPPHATASREIPLSGFSEGAVSLLHALLWPQCDLNGQLAVTHGPAVDSLRAELRRRWPRRGTPIAIQLPVRLSAISIEVGAQLFRTLAEVREEECKVRNGGRYSSFAGVTQKVVREK